MKVFLGFVVVIAILISRGQDVSRRSHGVQVLPKFIAKDLKPELTIPKCERQWSACELTI